MWVRMRKSSVTVYVYIAEVVNLGNISFVALLVFSDGTSLAFNERRLWRLWDLS